MLAITFGHRRVNETLVIVRLSQHINISEAPPQGDDCGTYDLTVSHSQHLGNNLLQRLFLVESVSTGATCNIH